MELHVPLTCCTVKSGRQLSRNLQHSHILKDSHAMRVLKHLVLLPYRVRLVSLIPYHS